jgi:hypothetical protein
MALWGNKDGAPFGSLTVDATGTVLSFSGSIESYNIQPGDTIIVDTAGVPQYGRVSYVVDSTTVQMENAFNVVIGKDAELQQSPKYTSLTDVTAGNILGADLTEVQNADSSVSNLDTPGWLRKYTKTRDGETKTYYEVLVAMSSISEDVVNEEFPVPTPPGSGDTLSITSQPGDITFDVGTMTEPEVKTTSVDITESGSNTTTYNWQYSEDGGSNFSDIIGSFYNGMLFESLENPAEPGPVTNTTDIIGFFLDPTDPSASSYDGWKIRVIITKGTATVTSAVATINVNP